MIIRIWTIKIPIFDVSTFFLDGHTENGRFDPFLHRNANGNMSHLKEQKKCYRISIVSEDRGGGAYRSTIHPRLIKLGHLIPLPKPNKPKGPVKNLRPVILLSVLRKILAIIVVGRTFDRLRKVISISQAAYSPGRSNTELVFTFKILAEKAICAQDFTLYLLMLNMSRAFDTIYQCIILKDLSELSLTNYT